MTSIPTTADLGRATGSAVWPMVVGDTISEPQLARLESEGLAWRRVAE